MRAVFDALARDDMDDLISYWAADGVYFNPTVGPAAEGREAVKATIAAMSTRLRSRGEMLAVDRVTEVAGSEPTRLFAEWHVDGGPAPGRLGVHVVLFNAEGLLSRVTVFAHPSS
jgi:ketosteroid isomerase-like protein